MGGTISCTPCNTTKNSSVPDFIFHNSSAPCSNAKLPGAHFILLFCFFVRFGGCFGLCIRCLFQGFLLRKMLDNFIFRQLQMALVDGPCLVRIVGQQAVHNIAVLFHRFIKALGTCQRINTELLVQRMDPCIHGFQKAVAAQFNQQPVQLRIHIRVGTQVLLGVQPLHLVQAVDQLLHIRRGQVVLQLADGVIFQQNAQVKNFLNVPRGKLFYKHTLVGDLHHQPVRSQLGTDIARKLVIEISGLQRQPVDVSKIVMAIKCGASDTTSGMASNCVIGYVADKLVDLGATVIFGETTEFLGGEHLLARRAVNKEVADKIYEIVTNMENRAKSIGCDMRKGQPTPGNIAGGLSSIEEKSLGAIVKSGTRPIQGVLEYPQHVTDQKGLWIKDTPGREPEILTGMAATGAQFMMFSTGRGAPQGFPSMPVIKICGNPNTYQRMENDMDLNAGLIITGDKTIEQVGEEAFAKLLRVLSGEMTKNEAIQYFSAIDIHCLGPVI